MKRGKKSIFICQLSWNHSHKRKQKSGQILVQVIIYYTILTYLQELSTYLVVPNIVLPQVQMLHSTS